MNVINTKQAAKLLGVSTSRVRQLLLKGKLRGWKAEGHPNRANWQIDEQSIWDYVRTRWEQGKG